MDLQDHGVRVKDLIRINNGSYGWCWKLKLMMKNIACEPDESGAQRSTGAQVVVVGLPPEVNSVAMACQLVRCAGLRVTP